jgi:hypothetical protein
LIIGTATGMAWGLTQSGFFRALAAAMTGLPSGSARCPVPPMCSTEIVRAFQAPCGGLKKFSREIKPHLSTEQIKEP